MAEQLNILIVPHTHWDREWYQTFEQFRIRLVRTIDKLLDILERDTSFSYFMLDGQTIVLDDYLEVQPEQEARLKQFTRSGRILVGPWYLQPDEFLVSGESLIRNLQIGLQRAAEFGEPMRIGYLPDCFGHIAQMPQILRGFGIDTAVFWRGVGADATKSEFQWAAPDGSRVLVVHLADPRGYANAQLMPLSPSEFVTRVELLTTPILPKATTNTLLFMNGSDHLEPQEGLPATIEAANALLAHLSPGREQMLAQYGHNENNGNSRHFDSIHLQIGTLPQYIEVVRQQNDEFQTLSGEMRSSQHAHLLPSVLSSRMWIKQQNNATEHLLEHWVEPLTAWAARLGLPYPHGLVKLAWKYLLQNHPHDSICGCSIDPVHRENSVRFAKSQQVGEGVLAQAMCCLAAATDTRAPFATPHTNHEPVPIIVFNAGPGPRTAEVQVVVQLPGSLYNAVIIDEQGQHMPYRVVNRWRQEIGSMPIAREMLAMAVALSGISNPAQLMQMAHSMILSALGQNDDTHVISRLHIEDYTESPIHHINHTPQSGVVYIEVMIAPKGRVVVNEQELLSAGQHVLSFLNREDIHTLEVSLVDQARETIDFVATDLPAYGLKTFWLYPRGLDVGAPLAGALATTPGNGGASLDLASPSAPTSAPFIENEWYRVEASPEDGTLTVTDKQTGAVFTGLNRFVDGGDVGDLYNYCPPTHDLLVNEPQESPRIELVSAGPVCATLRVRERWALPGACTANRAERSSRVTTCPIVSEISLKPGVRRIDIHTRIENRAKDHRLRVLFPVSYTVEDVAAEGTFEVRMRPIAQPRPADVAQWPEEPANTFPQKRFVDISNGEIGLGVLNRGLPECEILDLADGTNNVVAAYPGAGTGQMAVALTLLRCVEWLSRGDLPNRRGHAGPMEHTPEAQCQGHYEFDYALVPHSGDWEADEALVLREARAFNLPVRAIVTDQHEGQLPSRATLLEVEPRELVVSAIKQSNSGQGLVVRVYNPLNRAVEAQIRPGVACTRAFVANLQEEMQEQIFWRGEDAKPISVGVRGGEIMTIVFE